MTKYTLQPWFVRFGAVFEIGCGAVLLIVLAWLVIVFFGALAR
jgi:hypothetical protein